MTDASAKPKDEAQSFDNLLSQVAEKLLAEVYPSQLRSESLMPAVERANDKTKIPTDRLNFISKGADSYAIDYDASGHVKQVVECLGGKTTVLQAGKDFDDARLGADGRLTLLKEGKVQQARTLEGAHREFKYNDDGQLTQVLDRVHTNSGRDLIETTSRVGQSNIWDYSSNFGASGQRTNLIAEENGNFRFDTVRISAPNDLIDKDNSYELHQDLSKAQKHLVEVAREKGLGEFADNWTKKFEQRCRDQAHRGIKTATDEQIARTYDYLEKILTGRTRINNTQTKLLFQSALKEYAEPGKYINQGGHPSCAFAMTERHVVQTHPDDHARVLFEAVSAQAVRSKDGRKQIKLADIQIKPDGESVRAAKNDNKQIGEWSYSNKIFQLTAISIGYGGYRGNGYDMYGGTDEQTIRANRFISGEKNMSILQNGNLSNFEKVSAYLKNHGTIGLFDYIGGHAMAITDAKISNGKKYIYIDNWWNGDSEGWKRV